MKKFIIIVLILLTLAAVGTAYANSVRYRDQALRADSIEAAADTARLLHLAAMDDSTNAWQLRIVQTELQRDSLDRELELRPVVRVSAGLRIDTLRMADTVEVPIILHDTVKVYAFEGNDGPFAFRGDARVFPTDRALFDVRVNLTRPITVDARISCGQEQGIKSASVLLSAEDPFSVVPASVFQDPEICNPSVPIFQFSKGKMFWAGAGIVAGVLGSHLLDDGFRKARY